MTGEHTKQAFVGRHLVNRRVTGAGSLKDTRHHEIGLQGADVTYLPGDALGVIPHNDDRLVEHVLRAVDASGTEAVTLADGTTMTSHRALRDVLNLTTPTRRLLELMVARGAAELAPLLEKTHADQLKHYISGWNDAHDVLDVLEQHPSARLTVVELVETLRKTLPRLYSIASSQKAHGDEVHLLVVAVRYDVRGRERLGVTSTWLAERFPIGSHADMYLQNQQKHFAMPHDASTPIIMIGPGTGLAPFRAFIEERRITGATGANWLFFGEQRRATDFFYEEELTGYAADGHLRLDLAFSRDQASKVYVQHRLLEHGHDVWAWLEQGAELFVCGDKDRMASDVDHALHEIIQVAGGRSHDDAHLYLEHLRHTKRYKRDVY